MTLTIIPMTLDDLDLALGWARAEGWNPGADDAAAFHAADPGGFLMGRIGDEPVACISVVRQGAGFAFLGLYICRPEFRGLGHGWAVWQAGMALAGERVVGLDGVIAQQENYRRSGFALAHRNIRYLGRPGGTDGAGVRAASAVDLPALLALDRQATGLDRAAYLGPWLGGAPTRHTLVLEEGGAIRGAGTVRRCGEGAKIGPLYAPDAEAAMRLVAALSALEPEGALSVDVPEGQGRFIAALEAAGFAPVFETARMYRGTPPAGEAELLFGQATLELG